ncbi:MAG: AAA family ATPase [Byssovorax sp.]
MLIQFRVENHRSLCDEQVLSMVAAGTGEPGDERLIHRAGLEEALLPAVALYGANASGKTNVVGALRFMMEAVRDSQRLWEPDSGTPQEPFALSSKAGEPSLYEVDFLLDEVRYRYGFVLSAARVDEEWLEVWRDGEKRSLFERVADEFSFSVDLPGENEAIKALTRPNSLFLSAAAQNNHQALSSVFGWLSTAFFTSWNAPSHSVMSTEAALFGHLFGIGRPRSLIKDVHTSISRRRDAITQLLGSVDTGIIDIKVVQDDGASKRGLKWWLGTQSEIYLRHRTEDAEREAWLPLAVQSAGTITLLNMAIPITAVLERGGLLCVDELEANLHPMVALEIVRLFNDPKQNRHGAQILFTTHDTNLLGNVLGEPALRRDQVWLTEKDQKGATHLYPLTDFHPRADENLERGYLQGRYGAIPFLGQLVSLEAQSGGK